MGLFKQLAVAYVIGTAYGLAILTLISSCHSIACQLKGLMVVVVLGFVIQGVFWCLVMKYRGESH